MKEARWCNFGLRLTAGFMKQLPNLLKQESSSAATLINVLLRMYRDPRDAHRATRSGVLERLVP
jgi:brefeldin A-inhibited guanine nucleotide-exchange protein